VVPIVSESDAGLSEINSIGRQFERWNFGGSIQQWAAELPRFLLDQPTLGARTDATLILTVGGESARVIVGRVTAVANGVLARLETQTSDIVGMGAGSWSLYIWNDTIHHTDQSIYTGGGKVDVDTSKWVVTLGDYRLDKISLGLRVGTGIPDRSEVEQIDGHLQYKTEGIKFPDASKGHVIASATFVDREGRELELTGVVSSGDVQNLVQSKILHSGLGLAPEFPNTRELGIFVNAVLKR
jgi:hypothetical protein